MNRAHEHALAAEIALARSLLRDADYHHATLHLVPIAPDLARILDGGRDE